MSKKKVLITGVTGYLGSHIANILLKTHPNIAIIGTTKSSKNAQRMLQFKQSLGIHQSQVTLMDRDMNEGKECFSDLVRDVDYVFHTAAPLFTSSKLADNQDGIKRYIEATQTLVEESVKNKVKKVVYTGSATSVVGENPVKDEGFIYKDPYFWVDPKAINKPNEKAKILAEKVCWTAIKRQDSTVPDGHPKTTFISLLPYFMVGPPQYIDLINTNSSCIAINSILTNAQYGFPEIQLPISDVRDVAQAHIQAVTLDSMRHVNGRYLVSSESLWFSEILKVLKEDQKAMGLKIKTRIIGNIILGLGKLVNPEIKKLDPFLNQAIKLDGEAFMRDMGIKERDIRLSIKEMASQIVKLKEAEKNK
ncbi:hypothetical protein FGO68_gene2646 [Halteria grandinella]|uniref:NAD-dependent epimerase/dehydratase domain-containing protein n=1 Tax=Halteria grandinella TaxID=5974 RepID=A0A8J8T080_HALGN|nr:hypothetical protein FGO68_gene2646 [Halteria grandinella]